MNVSSPLDAPDPSRREVDFGSLTTEKPVTIAGVNIPANTPVLLGTGPASRDPKRFDTPEEFSLDRGTVNYPSCGRGPG